MTKPPAFQFYASDWVMGTRTLTPEQRGVFIDLLAFAWDQGGLPENVTELAGYLGVSPAKLRKIWAALEPKWSLNGDGRWHNERQEIERAKQRAWREKSAKGGRARMGKGR